MKFLDSFSQSIDLYTKNFKDFIFLSISRIGVGLALLLFALFLTFPSTFLIDPMQVSAYTLFYAITMIAIGILVFPFFMFPLISGIFDRVSKKKISVKQSFTSVREKYVQLLLATLTFAFLVILLVFQGSLMLIISPFVGIILVVIGAYIAVRLSFWDIFILKGEKKPMKASWKATEKNTFLIFATLALILLFTTGVSSFSTWIGLLSDNAMWTIIWSIIDTFIWILIPPLTVAPRVVLASTMIKEFNKK